VLRACLGGSALVGGLVAIGAARSTPAPAPATVIEDSALIDFSWYANSRFDWDPFLPEVQGPASLHALRPGTALWRDVPMRIREPIGGDKTAASVATTCFGQTLSLPLSAQPQQVVHLAMTGWLGFGPTTTTDEVAVVRVEHDGGERTEHTLRAREDVWSVLDLVPPEHQIAWTGIGFVHGLSLPIDRAAQRLTLGPAKRPDLCLSIFAVTVERGPGDFEPVDIAPIANADYTRNPFAPGPRLNFFPSLRPGRLSALGTTFLILNPHISQTGGTSLTSAHASLRRRVPLYARPSRGLAMLIDGALLPAHDAAVARFTVEYDRGADAVFDVHAQRDVTNYEEPAAPPVAFAGPPPQDLTLRRYPLDPSRTPRFLWIESLPGAEHDGERGGIAVFALTQELAR